MQEQREHLIRQVTRIVEIDYWLYLPREYALDERRWPLVLFLHGAGERGDVVKARRHGPAKRIAAGEELPYILVVPSCPTDRWWDPDQLEILLQEICATHRIDEDRVYGTGLSMGGFGTWATALTYPQRFAAIAPICGGGSPYLASRIRHVPVWAFHGAKDSVVPLYESQRMIDALQALGGEADITIYPEAGHDAWTAAYDDPTLWTWLLGKRGMLNVECEMLE